MAQTYPRSVPLKYVLLLVWQLSSVKTQRKVWIVVFKLNIYHKIFFTCSKPGLDLGRILVLVKEISQRIRPLLRVMIVKLTYEVKQESLWILQLTDDIDRGTSKRYPWEAEVREKKTSCSETECLCVNLRGQSGGAWLKHGVHWELQQDKKGPSEDGVGSSDVL